METKVCKITIPFFYLCISLIAGCIFLSNSLCAQNLIYNPGAEIWNDTTKLRVYGSTQIFPDIEGWYTNIADTKYVVFGLVGNNFSSLTSMNYRQTNQVEINSGRGTIMTWLGALGSNAYGRRYIQGLLTDSLEKDCFYSFEINIRPISKLGTPQLITNGWSISKNLGVIFTQNRLIDTTSPDGFEFVHMNLQPQFRTPSTYYLTDTSQFTYLQTNFQAAGGEKYISIGNFWHPDSNFVFHLASASIINPSTTSLFTGSGFFIDDLSLTLIPPPDSIFATSADTSMCAGTPITLFASGQHAQWYYWSNGSTDSTTTVTQPGTYWVEAGFNCGFTKTDTIVVSLAPDSPRAIPNQDTTLCPGQNTTLYNPWPDVQALQWSNGSTDSTLVVTVPGSYWLVAQTHCGHTRTDTMVVHPPRPLPYIAPPQDTTVCLGDYYNLVLPLDVHYFLDDAPTSSNNIAINQAGYYTLRAENNCFEKTFSFNVQTEVCQTKLLVPNTFTPNNDGVNDCFALVLSNYTEGSFEMYIADRWGNIVFESTNPEDCWTGTHNDSLIIGVYAYRISYKDYRGTYHQTSGTVRVVL